MKSYRVYTDGGCDPNPGPGGWGVVILEEGAEPREMAGGAPQTTNNRMEMQAAIEALRAIPERSTIHLMTDSQYLRNGVMKWMKGWKASGWQTKDRKPVKNQDLWELLDQEVARHDVVWHWVKGHAGDHWNERADALATSGIRRLPPVRLDLGALYLYCGVSYSGKDGSGAIAVRIRFVGDGEIGTVEKQVEKRFAGESANRLHLLAAIEGLRLLKRSMKVHVYTASDYAKDGATRWIDAWRARGWKTQEGKDVSHRDLWEELDRLCGLHQVAWHVAQKEGEVPPEMAAIKQRAHEVRLGEAAEVEPPTGAVC